MKSRIDPHSALESIYRAPIAPWREVPAKTIAQTLGTTTQTLANWRFRNEGPAFTVSSGNKVSYRLADIGAWLSSFLGDPATPDHINEGWLKLRGTVVGDTKQIIERLTRLQCVRYIEQTQPTTSA